MQSTNSPVVPCPGNSGISLRQEVPAACPGTLVVTSISDNDGVVTLADKPPSWSNYLPLPDPDNIKSRMLAAPGALNASLSEGLSVSKSVQGSVPLALHIFSSDNGAQHRIDVVGSVVCLGLERCMPFCT